MTRIEIENKIEDCSTKIKSLKLEIVALYYQSLLLSDDKQWFTEEIESHPKLKYQRKPYFLDGKSVGRIHWNENFKDEGTGKIITIERNKVVRINGDFI